MHDKLVVSHLTYANADFFLPIVWHCIALIMKNMGVGCSTAKCELLIETLKAEHDLVLNR